MIKGDYLVVTLEQLFITIFIEHGDIAYLRIIFQHMDTKLAVLLILLNLTLYLKLPYWMRTIFRRFNSYKCSPVFYIVYIHVIYKSEHKFTLYCHCLKKHIYIISSYSKCVLHIY